MREPDESYKRLVVPLRPQLLCAAARMTRSTRPSTRSTIDADDLVQETMARALRFWDTFEEGSNVEAWMFTILRNTHINRYNRGIRERSAAREVEAHARSFGDQVLSGDFGRARPCDADDTLESTRTVAAVRAAVASLPDPYREAVTLADLEGYSYKEIAEVMGCRIGTVMSRIYRGRKLLRSQLIGRAQELGIEVGG